MPLQGARVAVIGGGIGGLAAARAVALRGADVTVLEQAEAIREVGAGIQISPNGAAVLRGLGLAERLPGVVAQGMRAFDHAGREQMSLDFSALPEHQEYRFVHRADLVDLLADGAREAGARIRLLQRVDRVELGETPLLHLCNGAQWRADWVIGADGLHSRARAALMGEVQPSFTRQVAWRAVIPCEDLTPEVRLFMGPGRHLVTYPLRLGQEGEPGLRNIVAVEERADWAPESWSHEDDPERLRRAFAGFCARVRDLLNRVEKVHLWGLFRHPIAPRWHQGRVALLGDAAHPTLPFMAQGANLALEDAWVLAECLASEPPETALARYQARRAGRAQKVIASANRNAWKYHLRFPPLRAAAHLALRLGSAAAPNRMLHQFDWIYAHDVTGGERLA